MKFVDDYKNVRLPGYDYHNGWFFITNKTEKSKPNLVRKVHDLVKTGLEGISNICSGVSLGYATIVPTHVHCILVLEDSKLPLSEIWRRFKARCTYIAKDNGYNGKSLWQRNYYEHVIRNERALERIQEYIRNNPLKENLPFDEVYGR